jgi:hypothetical protein
MAFLVGLLLVLTIIAVYLAMLATWALLRDTTIDTTGKIARIVLAWLLPIGGPVILLRSVSELSPESMPPRALIAPFSWLLFVAPRKPNALAAEDEAPDAYGHRGHD